MGKGTRINVLEYCLDPFYIDLNFYKVFHIKKKAYANTPRTNKDPQ